MRRVPTGWRAGRMLWEWIECYAEKEGSKTALFPFTRALGD